jgi:hypothetical protein
MHRRVMIREPERFRVGSEIRQPDGSWIGDQQAQDPLATRPGTDEVFLGVRQSMGDELSKHSTAGVKHAERSVLGICQTAGGGDDPSQHSLEVEIGRDRQDRVEQAGIVRETNVHVNHANYLISSRPRRY